MSVANETIFWGAYIDYHGLSGGLNYASGGTIAASALAEFEANFGKQCSVVHVSGTPGKWGNGSGGTNAFSVMQSPADILIAAGRMIIAEWAPWDWALPASNYSFRPSEIAIGTWDTYITQYATDVKAWGKPIIFRVMHEANDTGGGFPWSFGSTGSNTVSGATATAWGHTGGWTVTMTDQIAAWKRIVGIFKNTIVVPNAKFFWCPNRWTSSQVTPSHGNGGSGPGMWPGSAWVDVMGIDSYPTQPSETLGNCLNGTGTLNWLSPMYTELCALDPILPVMVGETAFYGASGNTMAVTSIATNGTIWTIVVPTAPSSGSWLVGNSISITGATPGSSANPAAYTGQWTIASVSGSGPYTLTVTNTATPAAFVSGTGQLIDRITRAASIQQSFEIDLPSMPRIKAFTLYHVAGQGQIYEIDGNGSTSGNANGTGSTALTAAVDTVAFAKAIGNTHYLAGNQMGTNLAARSFLPYQDQPDTAGFERFLAVRKSMPGLVGLWLNNDASGPVLDYSGNARTGTVNGTATLGAANVILAVPAWTSLSLPGSVGNNVTVANNAAFSPWPNGKFTIECSFYLPSTPAAQGTIVSKLAASNFEWELFVTATQLSFTMHQIGGGTFSGSSKTLPTVGVAHHVIIVIDPTITATPFWWFLDGANPVSGFSASGSMAAGTAPVIFGQRGDATLPLQAGAHVGHVGLWTTYASTESVAELYSSWKAGPVISAISAVS